jgi:putative chitinase
MEITKQLLKSCLPSIKEENLDKYLPHLNNTLQKFEINSPERIAAFLAQCAHESVSFNIISENLNYSEKGLLTYFKKYFTPEQAKAYARKPEKIANRVYANRMENGDEASGDGWRYRGRGIIQTTGKRNYRLAGEKLNYDFVANPDDMTKPGAACMTAGLYWKENGLNELADAGTQETFKTITKRINGSYNGLADRLSHWETCKKALNILG